MNHLLDLKCNHFLTQAFVCQILAEENGKGKKIIKVQILLYKVLIKFWQSINEEVLKIEYLIILKANILETLVKIIFVVWPHDCLCNASKILAEFSKVFKFEKSLIYALPKFN